MFIQDSLPLSSFCVCVCGGYMILLFPVNIFSYSILLSLQTNCLKLYNLDSVLFFKSWWYILFNTTHQKISFQLVINIKLLLRYFRFFFIWSLRNPACILQLWCISIRTLNFHWEYISIFKLHKIYSGKSRFTYLHVSNPT